MLTVYSHWLQISQYNCTFPNSIILIQLQQTVERQLIACSCVQSAYPFPFMWVCTRPFVVPGYNFTKYERLSL